jgi:hypothetical protein
MRKIILVTFVTLVNYAVSQTTIKCNSFQSYSYQLSKYLDPIQENWEVRINDKSIVISPPNSAGKYEYTILKTDTFNQYIKRYVTINNYDKKGKIISTDNKVILFSKENDKWIIEILHNLYMQSRLNQL